MVTREMDTLVKDGESFSKERTLYVGNLSEISARIPEEILRKYKNFIFSYFRAQLRIARGQDKRAREILNGLDKKTGFLEFEEKNESLLAAIDISVRGSSNREDSRGDKIKPLFEISRSS